MFCCQRFTMIYIRAATDYIILRSFVRPVKRCAGGYIPLLSFESSGVKNNDRNPIPETHIQQECETDGQFNNKSKSSLTRRCVSIRRLSAAQSQLLQTSTSAQMMEFASAASSYFFPSPLILFLFAPHLSPPFPPLPGSGAQWLAPD